MCDSCEALMINGVLCHEFGCPDDWEGYEVECRWCGRYFVPLTKDTILCSEECIRDYYS